ncbi:hypothetical protein A9Q99_15595 [Gammaproteobacteria bacterium 45_16_T64]|nr:hypothetical protein A9Q99_15595 [Gammaproteobacteria bacterium 45_16_T64]
MTSNTAAPPPFLLPIEPNTLIQLIEAQTSNLPLADIFNACNAVELAALCTLYSAITSAKKAGKEIISPLKLERALGVLAEDIQEQGDHSRLSIIRRLHNANWSELQEQLSSYNLSLMETGDARASSTLNQQGIWDSSQQDKLSSNRPTDPTYHFNIQGIRAHDEQDVLLHELARNPEESLTLQGFAGCGKTVLVTRLSHLFNQRSTLYLTKNMGQITALAPKLGKSIKAWSFRYLAYYMLYYKMNGEAYWGKRTKLKRLSYRQLANYINARPMNGFTTDTVINIVDHIVSNYCQSADFDIGPQHCPWQLDGISPTLYIELANALWNTIKDPTPNSAMPILALHQIKMVDEMELPVPNNFRYVIVDESHDLPGSMANILKRSPQAVVALGDKFQITDGKKQSPLTLSNVRERHLFQSVRTGSNVDTLFNRVIDEHAGIALPGNFEGATSKDTAISTYTTFSLPDQPSAMLSREYWFAFVAIVKLANANRPFSIMPTTFSMLRSLIPQAIRFYHGHPTEHAHSQLMGYNQWRELVQYKGATNGLRDVDAIFRTGLTEDQFHQILSLNKGTSPAASDGSQNTYFIGLVTELKSMEMPYVMLAPDIFDSYILNLENQRTRILNLIYTGMSRALDGIILPKIESEWLLDA